MEVQKIDPKILLDRSRAENLVAGYIFPRENPQAIINHILHDLNIAKSSTIYPGKVTTCVVLASGHRVHIRRPDISTHDIVRGIIPYKDQVINLVNNTIRSVVAPVMSLAHYPSSLFGLYSDQSPVTVQYECTPLKYEHVLRKYMAKTTTETSLYFHYFNLGSRDFCGYTFPDGMKANQKLGRLYDTPSTKDNHHDMSVSRQYLYDHNIVTQGMYENTILPYSILAWSAVEDFLKSRNIILADTKLEFGINKITDSVCAMDEIFTMDSSRFWMEKDGEILCDENGDPISYSKEFARGMVEGNNPFTREQSNEIAIRYILAAQAITGELFNPILGSYEEIVREDLKKVLETIQ